MVRRTSTAQPSPAAARLPDLDSDVVRARGAVARAPVRTCVGCRKRAPAPELLRIVGVVAADGSVRLVPDPARRQPGRGASLHPDPTCLALAQRRRAFGRALRVTGEVDMDLLQQYVARHGTPDGQPTGRLEETAAIPGSQVTAR